MEVAYSLVLEKAEYHESVLGEKWETNDEHSLDAIADRYPTG